jgi:hypothetical protein
MAVKLYDPGSVMVIFGPNVLSGFSDGTMVRVERDEDAFTKKVGADGECTRTRNRNRCGSVVVTLMQTSASNLVLAALLTADELATTGVSILPLTVKDNAGNTLHTALNAWVKKTPASEFAKETGDREWTIDTGPMVNVEGGN